MTVMKTKRILKSCTEASWIPSLEPKFLLTKFLSLMFVGVMVITTASAQQLDFNKIDITDEAELSKVMPGLARKVIANYKDEDRQRYLNNLFRLQLIAGDYTAAKDTIRLFRDILRASDPVNASVTYKQYEIFSDAKLSQGAENISF